jgi:hypothetical protein
VAAPFLLFRLAYFLPAKTTIAAVEPITGADDYPETSVIRIRVRIRVRIRIAVAVTVSGVRRWRRSRPVWRACAVRGGLALLRQIRLLRIDILKCLRSVLSRDRDRRSDLERQHRFGIDQGGPSPREQHADNAHRRAGSRPDGCAASGSGPGADDCAKGGGATDGGGVAADRRLAVAVNHLRLNRYLLPVGERQSGEFDSQARGTFHTAGLLRFSNSRSQWSRAAQ